MTNLRFGHGYDVHRLVPGRKLILGGVDIPYGRGLDGHSDADVLTHAIMDALLGSIAAGDIGRWFPSDDERYKDADSIVLLRCVTEILSRRGYSVVNVDATLVAQAPKLAPYIDAMRRVLAGAMGIAEDRISVKATTEEGLGFTGGGDGMAAHAVALVEKEN